MSIRTILLAAASVVCMAALGQKSITAQECWLDGNFAARQPATATMDLSGLPVGLHSYSVRVQNSEGLWSSAVTKYFVIPSPIQPATSITACEYWIDSDISTRATIGASPAQIDITDLTIGLHTFSIRTQDNNGVWSSPITKYFIKEKVVEPTTIARYMYWIDDDVANRVVGELTATDGILPVTLPSTLADGTHTLSWRVGDSKGVWSNVRTETFNYIDPYVLQQDEDGYYLLGSVRDWQEFAELVNGGNTTADARMTADINLGNDQTMIGTQSVPYEGTFDGQGHTLTVNYNQSGVKDGIGPFYVIGAATIQNLHVDGNMVTNCAIGGIAGIVKGNATIQRCWVSATMQAIGSSLTGTIGGICSVLEGVDDAHLTIEDCLFDGVIVNNQFCGGFMSHVERASCSVTMRRGLNIGTYPTTTNENGTFIREVLSGARNLEASTLFHKKVFGKAQGTQVTDEQLASGAIAYNLQANRTDLVWGQRLGTDAEPVLTNDESYRVYKSKNGGYTNDPEEAMQQDGEGYFLLGSLQDWRAFAELINSGMNTANAKMTADINLGDDQTMIGLGSVDGQHGDGNLLYTGIFDGQGHTLTINYVTNERFVAPFRHIQDATIKNLRVAGTITTNNQFAAGIVGACYGQNRDNYITNCISSVNIVSSWENTADTYLGGSLIGGIIGKLCYFNRLHISDCIFNGSISGENRSVAWGGFVGLPDGTIIVRNSLQTAEFNCTNVLVGSNGSGTFSSRFGGGAAFSLDVDASNYYLNALGSVQGTQATTEQLADGTIATALQAGREEEIWVQGGTMPMLKLFASEITPDVPTGWEDGILPGKFTINANGDQIVFSQGNLQYQASTDVWRFAERQFDMIGSDNSNISDTYDGWIDLIQWGAGNNPTTTVMYTYNTFVEFGSHPISNGGNTPDAWRTMTKDEWVYIFCGRTNAESLFGLGAVNGVNGVIILPDNWTTPDDLTFNPSTEHGLAWQTSNGYYKSNTADGFSHNIYTSEQWTTMESNGAVFLPAAGIRYIGTKSIQQLGTGGYYWSSINSSSTHAYVAGFGADVLNPQHSGMQDYGHSIRLVQAVPSDPGPGTNIEEVGYGSPVTEKVLRNGQIYILRREKLYTLTGQEVK